MKSYHDIATDGGSNVIGQVTAHAARVAARMASVGRVVAVMSGKGGVGKSSVTVNLADALTQAGHPTGILDADINGPSIARMTGVRGQKLVLDSDGVRPAETALGLKIMSIDLFLADDRRPVRWEAPTQKDAFTWRGMMEMHAVREFLSDTAWGALDFLLIDLPPGADRLPNLVDLLPQLAGSIIVTLPTGVSQFVVGKSIHAVTDRTPLIGLIENMSTFMCPHCGEEEPLFPTGEVERLAAEHGVPFLGRLPFDPRLAVCAYAGTSFMHTHPGTPTAEAFRRLAEQVAAFPSLTAMSAEKAQRTQKK